MPAFDPYSEWLGLPPSTSRDFYQLLGLERFEADAERIAQGAGRRLAILGALDPGDRLADWERLCREIIAARDQLLNPAKKATYDVLLSPAAADAPAFSEPINAADWRDSASYQQRPPSPTPGGATPTDPHTHAPEDGTVRSIAAADNPAHALPTDLAETLLDGSARFPARRTRRRRARFNLVVAVFVALFIIGGSLFVGWSQQDLLLSWWHGQSPGVEPPASTSFPADAGDQTELSEQATRGNLAEGRASAGESMPAPIDDGPPPSDAHPAGPRPGTRAARTDDPTEQNPSAARGPSVADAADERAGSPQNLGSADSSALTKPTAPVSPVRVSAARPSANSTTSGPPIADMPAADFLRMLAEHRAALRARQWDLARQILSRASGSALSAEQLALRDRVELLERSVREFWNAVHERMAQLPATSELSLRDGPVAVVESTRESLTIRAAGQNLTYTETSLPFALALELATAWFDPADKANGQFLGAAHLVEAQGSRAEARRLWTEAGGEAASILLPLLDEPPLVATAPTERIDPPGKAALATAQRVVRAQFADEIKALKSAEARSRLARLLLEELPSATSDAERYALLLDAQSLAAKGDDAELLIQAVDRIGATYTIDAGKNRARACETAAKELDPAAAARLGAQSLEWAAAALSDQQAAVAASLLRSGLALARKANDTQLVATIRARQADLRATGQAGRPKRDMPAAAGSTQR